MPTHPDEAARANAEHRRWLIGVGISIVFGLFGAVMAWLSYAAKNPQSQPAPARVTPANGDANQGKHRQHKGRD
jgi:hypothetical protein